MEDKAAKRSSLRVDRPGILFYIFCFLTLFMDDKAARHGPLRVNMTFLKSPRRHCDARQEIGHRNLKAKIEITTPLEDRQWLVTTILSQKT
jgi:hypothetical protein